MHDERLGIAEQHFMKLRQLRFHHFFKVGNCLQGRDLKLGRFVALKFPHEQNRVGNALARGTETLFPVGRMDDTVPSRDQRPSVCNPPKTCCLQPEVFSFSTLSRVGIPIFRRWPIPFC